MINKKLLIIATAIITTISFGAQAKTQGNYLGLNLINTSTTNRDDALENQKHRNNNYSFGVEYKYAVNFDSFFLAPGIFYDHNAQNSDFSIADGDRASINIKSSYGIKANIGYDVTEKFSPFITTGYSVTRLDASVYGPSFANEELKESFNQEGFVYGLGFKYDFTKELSLNAAYEITQFGLHSNLDGAIGGSDKLNSDYKVAKIGVSYNF